MSTRASTELRRQLDRLARDVADLQSEKSRLQERYRSVLENSTEAIWCFELDEPIPVRLPENEQIEMMFDRGWLAEANYEMARMYGFEDGGKMTGTRLPVLLLRSDPANVDYLRTFIRCGYRLRDAESHEVGRDGEPRFFLNNLTGIVENGMLLRAWGTQRDITERKLAERRQDMALALYEEQKEMRAAAERARQRSDFLSEASTALASSLDYETTLTIVARLAVPRLADWCAVDIAADDGRCRRIAVAHRDPARVELAHELARKYPPRPDEPVPRALRSGRTQVSRTITDESLRQAARDPEHLSLLRQLGFRSSIVVPLIIRGQSTGAITFVTADSGRTYDGSDTAIAEELAWRASLAVDNAQLYASAQRNASEAETALLALEQSNEDLRQFAYVASHDLQEPLRTIASYTQLLSRRYHSRLDSQADEFIDFIVDASRRMSELIQDLLTYSRAANAPDPRRLRDISMHDVLESVLTNLKAAMSESGATVCASELPRIKADPAQMVQLLENLIANAIKYRAEAPPRIYLSAARTDSQWTISVRDNGIGIEPQYQERIFGIFKRLHGSKYPGTGVGLAICKRIVERNGGKIWVESDSGSGADFKFTLPSAS